jgi:ABC-type uncharacterized transport system auxiliary subunit
MIARMAVLALWLVASGCFRGRVPAIELYRLAPAAPFPATGAATVLSGSVAVAAYRTPGLYGDRQIPFRLTDNSYGVYPNREWALPLSTMLALLTKDLFAADGFASGGAFFDPPSRTPYTFRWEGVVRELEEVNRGAAVFAAAHFEARLVRVADDRIVWQGSARRERPVRDSRSMDAVVAELSAAAADVVRDLMTQLRRSPAVTPPGSE